MKNNLSYYRHEVNSHNHWKFKTLRRKYQWCGEGKFWALNNMIGESEGCKLDIRNPDKKAAIAADLDFDESEFDEYLSFLIEKCRLVILDEGYLLTPMTQENLVEVNNTRERKRNWKKQNSPSTQEKYPSTDSISPSPVGLLDGENEKLTVESKEEESKVKESKVKGITTSPNGDSDHFKKKVTPKTNDMSTAKDTEGIPLPFKGPAFASIWSEWLQYRKEARIKNYTPTGLKRVFAKLIRLSAGDESLAIEIVDQSLSNEWQGLFAIKQNFNGTHQRKPSEVGKTIEFDRP